jgi:hypothetical protein
MECFCKIEIAGLVEMSMCDRESEQMRLLIHIPPEGVDAVTSATDFFLDYGCCTYIPLDVTDEAFEILVHKVFDCDFIHVLADVKNHVLNPIFTFEINRAGQILYFQPRSRRSKKDIGHDIYQALKYAVIK